MGTKVVFSVFISLISLQGIICQNDFINCTYSDPYPYSYRCNLIINNTQGLDNFQDISGKHIDNQTDNDVQYLNCQSNIVSKNIPSIICQKFPNIIEMQFYHLEIERIDSYSFKGCKNLIILYLQYNQISKVDDQAFANNFKLQHLDLSYSQLSILPEKLFSSQQNLQTIYLHGNQITDMPDNIFQPLTNLTTLYLENNPIQNLKTEWFEPLSALSHLELSNSNLTGELPRNLFGSLKNIYHIGLRSSKIKVIHADTFGEALSIAQIDLGYNRIYAIHEKFIENTGPSYLDLNGNICADTSISDDSMSRKQMKETLKDCFEFYKMLIENNSSTTESSITTTGRTSTTSSSLHEVIQTIEYEVAHLRAMNEEMVANWKVQYLATAENKEDIGKLQAFGSDLKKEMEALKESIDEKNEGGAKNKDLTPHNVGNNFVSINFDGNYPRHDSDRGNFSKY